MDTRHSLETIIKFKQMSPTEIYEATCKIPFKEFIQTEDDRTRFTNHLLRLPKKIPPQEEKLLFFFFQTSLNYLKDFYNKNDQNLQTLGLLAALLNSDTSHSEPLYDQIVKETLQKAHLNNHQTTRNFYRQFSEMRDDNSPRIIEKHFWNIVKNYHPPEY